MLCEATIFYSLSLEISLSRTVISTNNLTSWLKFKDFHTAIKYGMTCRLSKLKQVSIQEQRITVETKPSAG